MLTSRVARRPLPRPSTRALIDLLEPRLLLTAAHAVSDLNGVATVAGMGAAGTVTFDGAGAISASTLSLFDGSSTTPTGTYTVGTDGAVTVTVPDNLAGAINANSDVVALSATGAANGLTLVIPQGSAITTTSVDGLWKIFLNGATAATSGDGTLTFKANQGSTTAGTVTGTLRTPGKSSAVTGTYTVATTGVLAVHLVIGGVNGTTADFTGQVNAGGTVMALNPADLAAAASGTRLVVGVNSQTGRNYARSDLAATWTVSSDLFSGTITTNALGQITAGALTDNQGVQDTVTGTVTVAPTTGAVTLTLRLQATGAPLRVVTETGFVSGDRENIVAGIAPAGTKGTDSVTVLTRSSNSAPIFTKATTLVGAVAGLPATLTYADLLDATDALDFEADPITFTVTALGSAGTVQVNGVDVVADTTTIGSGDTITFTSPDKPGTVTLFSVVAGDGTVATTKSVPIKVTVAPKPVVTVAASKPIAFELNGATTGAGQFTVTRTGDYKNTTLDVAYTVSGTAATDGSDYTATPALAGTVSFAAGERTKTIKINPVDDHVAEGNETVVLTLTAAPEYNLSPAATLKAATVTIRDNNKAPTFSTTTALTGAVQNTPVDIPFADFVTLTGATDPDENAVSFKIVSVAPGSTLTLNGDPVTPGVTLFGTGDTLTWTPPAGKTGTLPAFTVAATDGVLSSAPKLVRITVVAAAP